MAQFNTRQKHSLDTVDPVWARLRREGEDVARREPELASFIYSSLLHHDKLEDAVIHRIAERLRYLSNVRIVECVCSSVREIAELPNGI